MYLNSYCALRWLSCTSLTTIKLFSIGIINCYLLLALLAVCLAMLPVTGLYRVNGRWISMNTEHWWNFTDRFKPKYLEKSLSQCHFAHHKFHTNYPATEEWPTRWDKIQTNVKKKKKTPNHYKNNIYLKMTVCFQFFCTFKFTQDFLFISSSVKYELFVS